MLFNLAKLLSLSEGFCAYNRKSVTTIFLTIKSIQHEKNDIHKKGYSHNAFLMECFNQDFPCTILRRLKAADYE